MDGENFELFNRYGQIVTSGKGHLGGNGFKGSECSIFPASTSFQGGAITGERSSFGRLSNKFSSVVVHSQM